MDVLNKVTIPLQLSFNGFFTEGSPFGEALITYTTGFFDNPTTLASACATEFLGLHLNLGAKVNYNIDDISGAIGSRYYNLVYSPPATYEWTMRGKYATLCIHYSMPYLVLLSEHFSVLQNFIQQSKLKKLYVASSAPAKCTAEILQHVHDILHPNLPPIVRDVYLNVKLLDILLCCLKGLTHPPIADQPKIEQACAYILDHLHERFSPDLVADKVGLETHKLRKGFKMLYHLTMQDFILAERMSRALGYLRDSSLPISTIASRLGYKRLSTFSGLFKKKYGYYPSALRKVSH